MKKFGLEFQLVNRSQNEFAKIMDQQKRLEKQLNNTLKAFNKLQSTANNTSLDASIKKMDKLTNSVKRYNDAIMVFPANIVASIFKFSAKKMFEIAEAERENVKVEF